MDYFTVKIENNQLKFFKPEVLSRVNSGENSPTNLSRSNKKAEDDKKKKKKNKKNKKTTSDFNLDFKFYLTENLIGPNVTTLIE